MYLLSLIELVINRCSIEIEYVNTMLSVVNNDVNIVKKDGYLDFIIVLINIFFSMKKTCCIYLWLLSKILNDCSHTREMTKACEIFNPIRLG